MNETVGLMGETINFVPILIVGIMLLIGLVLLFFFNRYLAQIFGVTRANEIRSTAADLVRAAAQKAANGSLDDSGKAKKEYATALLKQTYPQLTDAQADMYIESAWYLVKMFIQAAGVIVTPEAPVLPVEPAALDMAPPKPGRRRTKTNS